MSSAMAAQSQHTDTSPGSSNFAFVEVTPPPEDGSVEPDDEVGTRPNDSKEKEDFMSITSSIYKGIIENGRRYQCLKEGEYWGPSDEQQFESMANTHLVQLLIDRLEANPYFRSPISENAERILDIGTGEAQWAIDVADHFENVTVYGVDLHPPPQTWVPPNCILEVDDVTKPWIWDEKFDLIHMRYLLGSFTDLQWRRIYREAYNNLKPGGWLEQVEPSVYNDCDDGTVPPDSTMAAWGPMFAECAAKMDIRLDTIDTMRGSMEAAGFTNVHERNHKMPKGEWCRNSVQKEIGKVHLAEVLAGLEGYAMRLLTQFGSPEPWKPERVQLMLMEMRRELNDPSRHAYARLKRVWCQKPLDAA